MNASQYGPTVIVVAAIVVAASVMLLNVSLQSSEAEHKAQESRIADAKREAEMNLRRFTAAFTHASIGMAIVLPDGTMSQVNLALCTLLGCPSQALLTRPFTDLLHAGDAQALELRAAAVARSSDESFTMEVRCIHSGGEDLWVSLHCGRFVDPTNDSSGLIFQLHNISARRVAEDELHHIAYHDGLTDLANRHAFNERLDVAVERHRDDPSRRFVVMFLDLDRFKVVNDSLGHIAGNAMLRVVARRLAGSVQSSDLVARLGGDEFAVLLQNVRDPEDAVALAHHLLHTLAAPIQINGTEVVPGASIGVTFSDLGVRTTDEVLRDADLAMYEAKASGRNRVTVFDAGMHERITEKMQLESDLRRAVAEGQISLVFQPMFELEPFRLIGFEALARWSHPVRGPISPLVFIALAEENGHIESLTAWVIERAAAQLAQWHAIGPHLTHLGIHVNISGRDLAHPYLVPHVRDVLARYALPTRALTLEITETTLMGRLDVALGALGRMRELGVNFSIDDFGTGYSSLAYLSTLPIDHLKIDRSFVSGMDRSPENVEIVRAMLTLGRTLNKIVVAEGIETPEQLATLREMGVHVGQGFLLSRPLRIEQVDAMLHGEERRAA
jgi:diguanylate cyclase (GGDEF)-like protein/PAS domain S-box-containing protein